MQGREVFVVDAVRSPIGRYGGGLATVRPDDMAAQVLAAVLAFMAALDPETRRRRVVFGGANQAGEDNRNVARMAILLAGLPTSIPGSTVNRLCASGSRRGDRQGSRDRRRRRRSRCGRRRRVHDTGAVRAAEAGPALSVAAWRAVVDDPWLADGEPGDAGAVVGQSGGGRGDPRRAVHDQPGGAGRVRRQEPPPSGPGLEGRRLRRAPGPARRGGVGQGREHPSRPATTESLAALRPAFRLDGTSRPGNASPLSEQRRAAVMLASASMAEDLGVEPLARVVASGAHGVDPQYYGIAPVVAVERALADRARPRVGSGVSPR